MRPARSWLLVGALVGAVAAIAVTGTVLAQTPTPTPGKPKTNYAEFFLDRLASALKVDRETLNQALKQARNESIDKAVEEGAISKEKAERLKSREGLAPWKFGFGGFKQWRKPPAPKLSPWPWAPLSLMSGPELREAIAQALGMTPQEVLLELRAGKSLKQLAQEKGKEQQVKDTILKLLKERLDRAVSNGRITQEEADKIYDRLQKSDLLAVYGRVWGGPPGRMGIKKQPEPESGSFSIRVVPRSGAL